MKIGNVPSQRSESPSDVAIHSAIKKHFLLQFRAVKAPHLAGDSGCNEYIQRIMHPTLLVYSDLPESNLELLDDKMVIRLDSERDR